MINMLNPTKEYKSKLLINAILEAEKNWPNNMDLGHVFRTFVHKTKDHKITDEDALYDLLIELSTKLKPCAL